MGDKPFLCEKQDPVPLLVDPDRMMDLPGGIRDQEEGAQLVETSKPLEAYLGLGLPPLIEEDGLVETGQHQVLFSLRRPGRTLHEAWNKIWDQTQHKFA